MESNIETEKISYLFKYINDNYDVYAEIKPRFLYENNIYIKTEKYDLNISIGKPDEKHYLFGKCDYYISFDYKANKKYRSELCWHGGGSHESYNEKDFSNVDKFLSKWLVKKDTKQFTIFDYEKE